MALNANTLINTIKGDLSGLTMTFDKPGGGTDVRHVFDFNATTIDGGKNMMNELVTAIVTRTLSHIVSNLEINGITITWPMTSATNVLVAGPYPVTGTTLVPQATLNQQNNGTGRVA